MKFIDRSDIQNWAERYDSKGNLPILIARLVRATTPMSTQADFPSGSASFVGGWDGIVNCQEEGAFVPKGISLWEIGTESNCKGKAEEDYNKRTADPLGFDPSQCCFVFVTPRFWKFKDKWRQAKLADGKWKDIKVFDSSNIEQWLDSAAAVSRWFSIYINKYPFDGIQTPEQFWDEWSAGPRVNFIPEIVTAGREIERKLIFDFLNSAPSLKAVKASTRSEAIAFIIASAKQFVPNESQRFFSKTLIVDTEANFRGIHINTSTPLNLIPTFEDSQPLYVAVSKGHHVLVPLGADDTFNQETITLPTIDRDGQIIGLVKTGLLKDEAEKFSREAGRNVTILKKLLGFPQNKAKWLIASNIHEIIPVLLIGRWNERYPGDREILEKFSGMKYEEYEKILSKWKDFEESPLIQIGETWRLTSPLDLWTNLSGFLSEGDFKMLREYFMLAFQNGNPFVEPKDDSSLFSKLISPQTIYSNWAREGLVQSLILIGIFGESLKMSGLSYPQLWVDNIIKDLLYNAEGKLWVSVNREMPLIAEASPISLFASLFESLSNESRPIMDMFVENENAFSYDSNHTGLLWALEGLAWLPEYFYNASLILLKLSSLDPGGHLGNRPMNSLVEIFKPWHFQTLAIFEERMEVLKEITNIEKESGWTLLLKMLPDQNNSAHPTYKLRWRMFDLNANINHTYPEAWKTDSFVVDLLISNFDFTEQKFSQLIEISARISTKDRDTILTFADSEWFDVVQHEYITWDILRKILFRHRSYPEAKWAMPENVLLRYSELYEKLEPTNPVQKHLWLFNDFFPGFPEGYQHKVGDPSSATDHQVKIDKARLEGVKAIIDQFGINKVLEISKIVSEPWSLGESFASAIDDKLDISMTLQLFDANSCNLKFAYGFVFRKVSLNNLKWAYNLYEQLKSNGLNNKNLGQIFVPLNQTKDVWDFIDNTNEEVISEYWLSINPRFFHVSKEEKIIGLNHLMNHKRFFSAIEICSHFSEEISTEFLVKLLRESATEKSKEPNNLKEYQVTKLFDTLDQREDIDHNTMFQLEWLYLPILASYGATRSPKNLHSQLAISPDFFVDLLKWIYVPKCQELSEEERLDLSDEIVQNRARQSYQLLDTWKIIPGVSDNGTIDQVFLNNWINRARELASQAERLDFADAQIGRVLAQYPETDINWPPDELCEIIETINTDSLKSNFSAATFNKRGATIRGPFDGGSIEKGQAEYFKKLELAHRKKYPNVASILSGLARGYLAEAKRMDELVERERLEY